MGKTGKELSNPFSTGGGGSLFEAHVQASFVALMLTGGFAPCLPCWPISMIKLQGKYAGYDTDDLIVFVEKPNTNQNWKLLGQIKHSISITEGDTVFGEVIQAAWNDFNNPKIFAKGKDVIALITGPLSATDISDVRTILEWARHAENSDDFLTKIDLAKFSNRRKQIKLKAFRFHLMKANHGEDISDDELLQFLRHFHILGYDLDIRAGVTLSLLHSLIGQYSQEKTQDLWRQCIEEIQSANKNAGTITKDTLPDELQDAFKIRTYEKIPVDFSRPSRSPVKLDLKQKLFDSELAITNLLGSWNEKSGADIVIASKLAKEDFSVWISKIREIIQQPESPVSLKNGIWTVTERLELWHTHGPWLFDDHLDIFKECALDILLERDPQFDLHPEERYTASIYGKVLKHSHNLRTGIAESLALLGCYPGALNNCSLGKPESIAILTIREIFENADWILWSTLNPLLPLFAEAAPDTFLKAVESTLQQTPCPFDELFSQEGSGVTGSNYLTGLLWALETLAWDERYLVRVSVILGELASHDPGGNWANRPSNSLTTIFLPWLPQTTAPIEKRKVALQTLRKETPGVAWKLLLSLLPNQDQISMGSHKPSWRKIIPEDWEKDITQKDYWDQVSYYGKMAVEMAKLNNGRLNELVAHLDNLPQQSFEEILDYLSSEDIVGRPENYRLGLWTALVEFISKHKRFANAKWPLNPDLVLKIDEIARMIAPQNPLNLHRRLFSGSDFDLYSENENWQEQQKDLEERRRRAVTEILDFDGIDAVIQFAETVDSPRIVGYSLGFIAGAETDSAIFPILLDIENKNLAQFTNGFVWGRYQNLGWDWVDKINTSGWSNAQKGQFLASLPFTTGTWIRSKKWLNDFEGHYWSITSVNPYQADGDLNVAIDKLIANNRPNAAIDCLYKILHDKQPLDNTRAVKALMLAVSSTEPFHSMDSYQIVEIIKAMQNDPEMNPEDLFRIEWAYLSLLDSHHRASPRFLENRLASDPDFFCEFIRLVYRSKKENKSDKEPTEQEKAIATNAYRLLHEWRTPPGMQANGGFSEEHFSKWLESTKTLCRQSGHMEVALTHVGSVLIYCPPDPDGLWIHRGVADALNSKDADKMRDGFRMAIFNSRGVHWIDPTGKPELELSAKYRKQAEEVENVGYQRLAVTLRELADSYDNEAKRIIDEHNQEVGSDS